MAVRNAVRELKEIADYIIRSNDEDAVLKTILQILSLQKREKGDVDPKELEILGKKKRFPPP
jgi:haloacid dehalogenase-like hydrolase.